MMRTLLTLLIVATTAIVASARDIVELKDGRRVEGDIVREIDGNVWMYVYFGDLKKQEFFAAVSIEKIERDAIADEADRDDAPQEKATARTGVPRGMVLTLEPSLPLGPGRMLVHEENIVIGESGAEWLSPPAPRDIPVIDWPV